MIPFAGKAVGKIFSIKAKGCFFDENQEQTE